MADYDNTNTISIFKNKKKEKDSHPDYRVVLNVDGIDKEGALWLKTSKAGEKYMSGKLSDPYQKESAPEPAAKKTEELESDLPF